MLTRNYQNLAVAIQLLESVKPPFCLLRHNLLQDGKKTADAAISFGNITLVHQDLVKKMIAESMKAWELRHQEELNALKLELREVKTSQEFICAKYEQRWSPREHIFKSLALASKPQVLGLGLEALGPRKLPCPRLENSTIFQTVEILLENARNLAENL